MESIVPTNLASDLWNNGDTSQLFSWPLQFVCQFGDDKLS